MKSYLSENSSFLLHKPLAMIMIFTFINIRTCMYEGWNFNSGNYLFTTDTK